MQTIFKMDANDIEELSSYIKKIPDLAENILNDYLWNDGANIVIKYIKKEMPIGVNNNKKYKGYPREHAAKAVSLEFTKVNLGFAVKTKQNPFFGYLYFPSFAEGTSRRNAPNPFFENGANEAKDIIVKQLVERLENKVKEGI